MAESVEPCRLRCPEPVPAPGHRTGFPSATITIPVIPLTAVAVLLAAAVVPPAARAGSLTGTAILREPIALPPEAVFEVVLIDAARADAPARELGRVRLHPAGQPPFRFSIPYRDSDFTPAGRYAVRATVHSGDRLLFTTDTITPVLTGGPSRPLTLQLVPVGAGRPPGARSPLGPSPASWGGDLSAAGAASHWRLEPTGDRLVRLADPTPIEPRLHLQGMFRYMADAASLRLCATGARLPVAMEGDFRRLERAYLAALPACAAGQPLLVNLEGLITSRPSAEAGRPPERTLVVERFVAVHPGNGCPPQAVAPTAWPSAVVPPPLRGTLWRLQALQDGDGPTLSQPPGRPGELQLAADRDRLSGTGGCNRLMGGFRLAGEQSRFSPVASTQMACPQEAMAFERRYVAALARVRRWSLDRSSLLLQDGRGRTLLLFTAVAPLSTDG